MAGLATFFAAPSPKAGLATLSPASFPKAGLATMSPKPAIHPLTLQARPHTHAPTPQHTPTPARDDMPHEYTSSSRTAGALGSNSNDRTRRSSARRSVVCIRARAIGALPLATWARICIREVGRTPNPAPRMTLRRVPYQSVRHLSAAACHLHVHVLETFRCRAPTGQKDM
eukprot:363461-Chlamydomonas_euryale.AAC.8